MKEVGDGQFNDIHLIELKQLAKAIKDQILEERKGPFLWSKDSGERGAPCGVHTTQSDTLAGHGPEGAPSILSSDLSNERLSVDLCHLREKQRVIEDSFRIQKHHLSIRPIYHFKPERIEAHILLCYMAFTMIRHFQFRMEKQQSRVTLDEMRHELWRVQAGILQDEITQKWYRIPSAMGPQAKKMYQVFGLKRELQPQELKY